MMNSIILRMTLLILSWYVTTKQNNMIQISSLSYVLFFTHIPPLHWNQRCKITPKTLWTVGKVTPFLHVQVSIIHIEIPIASDSTKQDKMCYEFIKKYIMKIKKVYHFQLDKLIFLNLFKVSQTQYLPSIIFPISYTFKKTDPSVYAIINII